MRLINLKHMILILLLLLYLVWTLHFLLSRVDLTWAPTIFLHFSQSLACSSSSESLIPVLFSTAFIQAVLGLLLVLIHSTFPFRNIFDKLSSFMRWTCPSYLCYITLRTPNIVINAAISKVSSFLPSDALSDKFSQQYIAIGWISALYSLIFFGMLTPWPFHVILHPVAVRWDVCT